MTTFVSRLRRQREVDGECDAGLVARREAAAREQATVALPEQVKLSLRSDARVNPAGSVSVTSTGVAAAPPMLLTLMTRGLASPQPLARCGTW